VITSRSNGRRHPLPILLIVAEHDTMAPTGPAIRREHADADHA
jgi:hypothetical protein